MPDGLGKTVALVIIAMVAVGAIAALIASRWK
jgi:hypothetical protein